MAIEGLDIERQQFSRVCAGKYDLQLEFNPGGFVAVYGLMCIFSEGTLKPVWPNNLDNLSSITSLIERYPLRWVLHDGKLKIIFDNDQYLLIHNDGSYPEAGFIFFPACSMAIEG